MPSSTFVHHHSATSFSLLLFPPSLSGSSSLCLCYLFPSFSRASCCSTFHVLLLLLAPRLLSPLNFFKFCKQLHNILRGKSSLFSPAGLIDSTPCTLCSSRSVCVCVCLYGMHASQYRPVPFRSLTAAFSLFARACVGMFFYVLVLWGNRATKASLKVAKELSHSFICGLQAHVHARTHTHIHSHVRARTRRGCVLT